jgi:N-acetylneuraminic acid mutarotase
MRRREFITLLGGTAAGWPALATSVLLPAAAFAQGTGRWTSGAPMPSARTEIAVGEVIGKIYVVGGFRGERELEIYDPSTDRWSRGNAIPRALHHAAAVGLNGKLYVIGGFVEGWTPTDEVHEYDPATDRWQKLAPLPTTPRRTGGRRARWQDPRRRRHRLARPEHPSARSLRSCCQSMPPSAPMSQLRGTTWRSPR